MTTLATLRSRRVGLGYSIESGEAETREATGRTLQQQRGPLAFVSEHPTLPLSEVEEAIVAWSACGPNGLAHWDIAVHGGFHELVHIAGRTAASPGNSFATDLLVIKDQGAFLYNPGTERERMVEIQGEDDYHKVLDWYRRGMHQILDHRPDVDWGLRAPGAPNASLFGPYQFNVNREGTTWFIPITDIGWLYFSVMLNLFDAWHLYFTDDQTGEPAGGGGDGPWKLDLLWLLRRYPHGSVPRPRQGARVSRRAAERAGAAGIRSPEDLRDGGRQGGDLRPVTAVPRRAGRDAGDDGGEVRAGPDDVQGRGQLDAHPQRPVQGGHGFGDTQPPGRPGLRLGRGGGGRLRGLLRGALRAVPGDLQPDAVQLRRGDPPRRPGILRALLRRLVGHADDQAAHGSLALSDERGGQMPPAPVTCPGWPGWASVTREGSRSPRARKG